MIKNLILTIVCLGLLWGCAGTQGYSVYKVKDSFFKKLINKA
jgi:hypothetical protein